ncbi:MAG: tandem-95 repeat protein [Pseudomonadota bacterium]
MDLLANDSDPDGDPITFDTFTQPTNGAIVDNGDGTLTYTPNPGFSGPDSFTYTIIAAGETDTATVTVNVETPPPSSNIVSDDFASAALDPAWTIEGATGVTAALGGAGPERYLTLTTPTGNYDLWNARYNAARATQPADNGDFEVEAKFLTQVNDGNEFQGIVVEQDVSNWIRFDTYTNGSNHYIFAAVTLGNVSSARINSVISAGDAQYIRVNRIGDDWTLSYSSDGQNWNVAGSFTQALTVAKVGPFAGSTTPANGFSAQVDYFFNAASPLADDQSVPAAPVANDDLVSTAAGAALAINIANDLLGNDTDQNEDNILFDSFTNPASGSLIDNGDGTLTYTPVGGFTGVDSFTYTATDGSLTDTATVFVDIDNQAPTAANDTVATDEDTAVVIAVLSNDSDANGDAFQILTSGSAANGTVVNNGDGTVTYTPNANFVGADSFTYTISDGIESSTATVNVTVNGVDDAPQPVNDTAFVVIDGMLIIDIAADLLANDIELDGQTLQFVGFDQPSNGLVVDNGDGTLTYTPNIGFTGNEAITYRVTDGTTPAVAATLNVAVNEGIEVWYGDTQNFGALGEPQNWVNILGSVDINEVTSLSYTLNGGASVSLVLGPDTRRLQEDGDFNIEIDYSQLDPTATDDTIVITAQRVGGGTFTRTVTIDYEAGNDWAADYSIDWDAATSITDVVQVVDGKWSATADGLRLDETGYDRIVALGDQTWDFYEVNLTVEMHDLSTTHPRDNSAIAFGFHWSGHTDNPRAGFSPHAGWEDSAGLYFWTGEEVSFDRYYGWTTGPNSGIALNNFEEGNTYNFKIRLEQSGVLDKTYSYKAWEVGATEPVDWTYQTTDTFGDPITGAFLLNAHYFDVTFGDVTVTEIQGSDIIAAKNSSDTIIAVEIGATNPGIGEIDVLQGGAGADVFVLGDGSQAYYDDGDVNDAGWEDFALIWDFVSGEDQVRLHGAASDYYFASAPVSVYTGDAIYRTEAGGTDELVAVFEGVTGLTLSSSDFDYENGLA